jgi:hypothetical protein
MTDDDGAPIRRLKLNDIRDVIKEKTRRLSCLPLTGARAAGASILTLLVPKPGAPLPGAPF